MRRVRRSALFAAAAALSLAACRDDIVRPASADGPAVPPPRLDFGLGPGFTYMLVTTKDLGTLGTNAYGDRYSQAYGINDSGVVTGTTTKTNATWRAAFVWRQATGMQWTGVFGVGRRINLAGTIAGDRQVPAVFDAFALTADGQFSPISPWPGDYGIEANGINDLGHVVARSKGDPNDGSDHWSMGIRWDPVTHTSSSYVFAAGHSTVLTAIDNNLRVSGETAGQGVAWTGFRFTPGTGYELIAPPLPGYSSETADMNENGVVAGTTYLEGPPAGSHRAFRWSGPTDMLLLGSAAEESDAQGINRDGYVVGRVDGRPAFWTLAGTRVFLPRLTQGTGPCLNGCFASDVNKKLEIVGDDIAADGHPHAVLWRVHIYGMPQVKIGPVVNGGVGGWYTISLGSGAQIPVTLYGSRDVDVRRVDPAVLSLGDGDDDDTPVARGRDGRPLASVQDVNGDGLPDLVAYFDQAAMERHRDLTSATTQLLLVADFGDGTYLRGTDRVVVR